MYLDPRPLNFPTKTLHFLHLLQFLLFRVARKRLAHFAIGKSQSASSSPRLSTRVSMSSNTNDTDISAVDEAIENEDSEWRQSQTPPNGAKRRRAVLNHGGGSLPPNNAQTPRHSSRIRPR